LLEAGLSEQLSDVARLTLDELVSSLISGRPIDAQGSGADALPPAARKALAFYARRRQLWWSAPSNVTEPEVRELIDALAASDPDASEAPMPTQRSAAMWRPLRVEIEQFGGLHAHCATEGADPTPLRLNLEKALVACSGRNGAGKSSLANAISWVLTGLIQRPQTAPAKPGVDTAFQVSDEHNGDFPPGSREFQLPPIVPMPTAEELRSVGGVPRVRTAVRLTLERADGSGLVVVERRLERRARGAIAEMLSVDGADCEDLAAALGVPARSIELAAVMLHRVPHIRFDEPNDLARALAEVTGLRPLQHLGQRSRRVQEHLRSILPRKLRKEQEAEATRFSDGAARLRKHLTDNDFPALAADVPSTLNPETAEAGARSLVGLSAAIANEARRLSGALAGLLGLEAQALTPSDRRSLAATVEDASQQLRGAALRDLPSMRFIEQLRLISEQDAAAARAVLDALASEAEAVTRREARRATAARERLFALVARWHDEHHPGGAPFEACPVCSTQLGPEALDPVLGAPVRQALEAARQAEDHATMTLRGWSEAALRRLPEMLPSTVAAMADASLPDAPVDLYRAAISVELLSHRAFRGQLEPIARLARADWEREEAGLPAYAPVAFDPLPGFEQSDPLQERVSRIRRALAFAAWRHVNTNALRAAVSAVLGRGQPDSSGIAASRPVGIEGRLGQIREALALVLPVDNAMGQVRPLQEGMEAWQRIADLIARSVSAADDVAPLIGLEALVREQIEGLVEALNDRTRHWLGLLFQRSTENSPEAHTFRQEASAIVALARYGGVVGPAHEVTNSSALRAYLFAFVLALRERVLATDGGLSLLLMDDPQHLFDERNQARVADTVGRLAGEGSRILLTTHDVRFAACAVGAARQHGAAVDDLRIVPRSRGQSSVRFAATRAELGVARDEWKRAKDDDSLIMRFVECVRVHIEAELLDLLAYAPVDVPDRPSLGSLLEAIRRARRAHFPGLSHPDVQTFLDHRALRDGGPFRKAANQAHHGRAELLETPDADEVDESLDGLLSALGSCRAAYQAWLASFTPGGATTPPPATAPNVVLLPPTIARRALRTVALAAARDSASAPSGGEEVTFRQLEFEPEKHRLFGVNVPWLGMACLPGQTLIVDTADAGIPGDLVVVAHARQAFPGRLVARGDADGEIVLAPEPSPDGKPPKGRTFRRAAVETYRVRGVLFDRADPNDLGPVYPVETSRVLNAATEAVEISGHSASPLLRPGDLAIVSSRVHAEDGRELERHRRRIVAVALEDGEFLVKRLGRRVDESGLVRVLESVGLMGETEIVRFSDAVQPGFRATPLVLEFRDVLGFWFN
jgi:hypothetical protein